MLRKLSSEQPTSLVARLRSADVKNGDIAELTLAGVGVHIDPRGNPSVAFCPSHILSVKILKSGTKSDRRQPMPFGIRMSNNLQKRILRHAPEHGFIQLRLQIHSNHKNGVLYLSGHMEEPQEVLQHIAVHNTSSFDEYQLRKSLRG